MIMEVSTVLSGYYQRSIVSVSREAELQPLNMIAANLGTTQSPERWLQTYQGFSEENLDYYLLCRYQDTQSTIVFPSNNSSHSLFNLPSCCGVEPGHSYNLETTAPKLATAPLVAAPALQYGVWLQVLSGYGQI